MNVIVDGLMTSYLKTGKGKPLVFLPGWGDSKETFAALVAELKEDYEIYALDLPGFGGTQAPPLAWSLQDYVDFINAWLKKIDLKPYVLVGHSYGGALAILLGSQIKVPKLVLLASAGIRNKNPLRKKALYGVAKAGKVSLLILPTARRQRIRQRFYKSVGSDATLLPHMEATFRIIINEDVRPAAVKVTSPTLLIYGSHDKSTPTSDGQLLHRAISGSKLEILDGGHFLHQEQPQQTAELIQRFIKGSKNA
ncbi:MAG TPA: alpha/beta hydrolase [Candidatus Saccharimonadales bacterium]|nr:alpha/beta hydrolase [Candidatus Saccharimonadales bacterium]